MNFFIFNSNPMRTVLIFGLVVLALFSCLNGALKGYIFLRSSNVSFIQDVNSKGKHMRLNYKTHNPDVVFIGNSHTEYHISTATFNDYNIDIYNYGVSGTAFSNYNSMAQDSAKIKPRYVAVGIPVNELYSQVLQIKPGLRYHDVKGIWNSSFGLSEKTKAIFAYLSGFNAIRLYADALYSRIEGVYAKFTPINGDVSTKVEKKKTPVFDCKVTEKTQLKEALMSYQCSNGDLIMDGVLGDVEIDFTSEILGSLNYKKINLLKQIINNLSLDDVKFILILEPHLAQQFIYNKSELGELLGVDIIDFTNLKIFPKMWGDSGHLNYDGKKFYSNKLAQELERILRL